MSGKAVAIEEREGFERWSAPEKMRAARLHEVDSPLRVDVIETPRPQAGEVLVEVRACGVVPNLPNALKRAARLPRPPLPAIYGLDASGVVVETGPHVHGIEVGTRVYVNPLRCCGGCPACRSGDVMSCDYVALAGYLGSGPKSPAMMADYPFGGFAEYLLAPQASLVVLPENVSFEVAARWGYLGTGYSGLRRAGVSSGTTVLINGISGTLGLGTALFALALGARKVLGVGRDLERLAHVKAIDPGRIEVLSSQDGFSVEDWARSHTSGRGADVVVDALMTGSSAAAFQGALAALARGGTHVNVGGVLEEIPVNFFQFMNRHQTYMGSFWFSTCEAQQMADMAEVGAVNLDVFETTAFDLEDINMAISSLSKRHGGFSNYVITPHSNRRNSPGAPAPQQGVRGTYPGF